VANGHFGNLGDVWKHAVIAETLVSERPASYWETHSGSASYLLTRSPARDYGIFRLLESGQQSAIISRSRYYCEMEELADGQQLPSSYPGSPLLAMRILGSDAAYLFCDLDPESIATLDEAAEALGLSGRVRCARADGLKTVREASRAYAGDPGEVVVHVDPFDPFDETEPGLSAVSLASELAVRGFRVIYWYGYDSPEQRAWPWKEIQQPRSSRWCGDLIVRSNLDGGSLAPMSEIAPLIGAGLVCANLDPATCVALQRLGEAFASLYETAHLLEPGASGALEFLELVS
jgi:23S rRNA A2030 N6-methylase RlmJ